MNRKDRLSLAILNLQAGKKMIRKMVFILSFIFMLLLCFAVIISTFFSFKDEYNNKHTNDCYVYTLLRDIKPDAAALGQIISETTAVAGETTSYDLGHLLKLSRNDLTNYYICGNAILKIGEKQYPYTTQNSYSRDVYETLKNSNYELELSLYQKGFTIFPQTLFNSSPIIAGRYPDDEGQILLDTYLLSVFGYTGSYEELVGQTISLYDGVEDKSVLLDYKISGVFDAKALRIRESGQNEDYHLEHLYVNLKAEDNLYFNIPYGSIRRYYPDFEALVKECTNLRQILQFEFGSSENGEYKMLYSGLLYSVIDLIMGRLGFLLIIIMLVACLICICSTVYLWYFYRKRNAHYRRMLSYIGMRNRDRTKIVSIEINIIMLRALLLGIYMSAIFLFLFGTLIKKMLSFSLAFSFPIIAVTMIMAYAIIYVIFFASESADFLISASHN